MKKLTVYAFTYFSFMSLGFAAGGHEKAGYGAEEAGSGGLPQFDPTWFASQIFWLAIAFAIMYLFFSLKTLPTISSVIENRQNHIQADLDAAETLKEEAEAARLSYEQSIQIAREKASQSKADVEKVIKDLTTEQTNDFRKRSEEELKAAQNRIDAVKIKSMEEMNTIAAVVASSAVEKIIGVNTDVQNAESIIKDLMGKKRAA